MYGLCLIKYQGAFLLFNVGLGMGTCTCSCCTLVFGLRPTPDHSILHSGVVVRR